MSNARRDRRGLARGMSCLGPFGSPTISPECENGFIWFRVPHPCWSTEYRCSNMAISSSNTQRDCDQHLVKRVRRHDEAPAAILLALCGDASRDMTHDDMHCMVKGLIRRPKGGAEGQCHCAR